jgi:hypothetical protein
VVFSQGFDVQKIIKFDKTVELEARIMAIEKTVRRMRCFVR